MDGPDLMSLGQHCAEPDCRQRDFLPFTCDCCGKVYCLEHRTYAGHACEKAEARLGTTIVCPLCARAIKVAHTDNPHVVFDRHAANECDPSNYAKVMRKKKCPVPGCKEKLTSINTYQCKHCSESVCLRHRLPESHECAKRPQPGPRPQQGAVASLRRLFNFDSAPTVARAQQPQPSKVPAPDRKGNRGARSQGSAATSSAQETCPICRARFDSLNDLIAHSAVHQPRSTGAETCPHCRASFPDPVALVEHVERQHNSSSSTACVLS